MSVESDVTYLKSLGTTKGVLEALIADTKDDLEVVTAPFSELLNSSDKAFTVPISFLGNTLQITVRKDLSDNDWWITEEGTVNGEEVKFISRFTLNSFLHKHANYSYIIVSPYEYNKDDDKLSISCIANASLLIKY